MTTSSTPPSPAPRPLAPTDDQPFEAADATFQWEPVSNATGYHVQVATTSDFARPLLDVSTGTATSLTPDATLPDDASTLYWRVRAQHSEGPSSWSAPQPFTPSTSQPEPETSSNPPATASRHRGDEATAPVRQGRTSPGLAAFWILLAIISFALTLVLLFRAAVQIP